MFFDEIARIPEIARRGGCSIFVLPCLEEVELVGALVLSPEEDKKSISVEEVRDFTMTAGNKESNDRLMVIRPAEALTVAAQNALLKNLEEPGEHYHYILLTTRPGALLATIRSRSACYFLRRAGALEAPVVASEKVKDYARSLIAASAKELPAIAEKLAKDKDKMGARALAEQVTATAIEILEKSYFKTGRVDFLTKLPKFIKLAEALAQNGHVKLHIVADLC